MPGNRDPLAKGTGQDAHPRGADVLERMPVIHAAILQTAAGEAATHLLQVAGPPGLGEAPGEGTCGGSLGKHRYYCSSAGRAGEREARTVNKRKPWGADRPSQPGRVPEEVTP